MKNTLLKFTKREKEILRYLALGMSSKQIAGALFISKNTVANHRRNMLRKNGAKSSAELIHLGIHNILN